MTTEDKKPEEKKPDEKKKGASSHPFADVPKGIPVKVLRFVRPLQVPGRQSDDTLKTDTHPNGRRWELEYIPQIRHHKVTYFDRNEEPPVVGYVHETHVLSWEPLQ